MARGGINKVVVQQARDALLARGEHPSIDAVRIELGNTGSKTTIHRYLKELGDRQPVALEGTACVSEPLARLVEQLAAQLLEEAKARVDAAEAAFNQQRDQLQAQLQLAQRALAAAHQQIREQADALQSESQAHSTTQAMLQAEQLRSVSLKQSLGELQLRLADKDEQIRSLEEKHHAAREALAHYREQREQEQRRIDTQVRQLQGQLQTLQQGAMAHQETSTRLHRDNERLLAEQRQAVAQRTELCQQLEQRDAQVQGLRAILAQAQGASEEMRRQLTSCEARLAGRA
ncbi:MULTISPECIES: DNA-binding protein [unclassified Pseudomonas]|uniref:DNA-binding protein n=1 Tax=unclassified Pseudomonas TaxID=196821 RepID=UPI002447555C|nr:MULTISPECIES: DNA-binding protein [unclassified Pseudomonas]MDH0301729.1 DNA-binding protein [Pseudomonas sp. GD04091]MDH1984948.1 DNA-binding protein [Pseudomonas sp. GD03689]